MTLFVQTINVTWAQTICGGCNNSVDGGGWTDSIIARLNSTLKPVELLIQLQDFENVTKYAKYGDFQVGSETENFKLIKVGPYTGDVGDSFSQHVGYSFTTKDRDNDGNPDGNCAIDFTAGWWYRNCYQSNLNGKYL
ncbi:hypothetical protein DOY81_014334 [Sarcophaga bullata]|nr:hypothetical protein DOY81_014334 [Sarcophaga bullata]